MATTRRSFLKSAAALMKAAMLPGGIPEALVKSPAEAARVVSSTTNLPDWLRGLLFLVEKAENDRQRFYGEEFSSELESAPFQSRAWAAEARRAYKNDKALLAEGIREGFLNRDQTLSTIETLSDGSKRTVKTPISNFFNPRQIVADFEESWKHPVRTSRPGLYKMLSPDELYKKARAVHEASQRVEESKHRMQQKARQSSQSATARPTAPAAIPPQQPGLPRRGLGSTGWSEVGAPSSLKTRAALGGMAGAARLHTPGRAGVTRPGVAGAMLAALPLAALAIQALRSAYSNPDSEIEP